MEVSLNRNLTISARSREIHALARLAFSETPGSKSVFCYEPKSFRL